MSAKSILQKIKRVFGLSQPAADSEPPAETETEVTVEREPDTASVGGTETESAGGTVEPAGDEPDEQGDATASGEESAEPAHEQSEAEPAHEQAEPSGEQTEPTGTEPEGGADSVDAVKGIGPTYSDRLSEAGIETVGDLADAEPEAVAEAAETGESKAGSWIDRARERLS